jgi:hypothetical protein
MECDHPNTKGRTMPVKKTLLLRSCLLALAMHAGVLHAQTAPVADSPGDQARVKRSPAIVVPVVATSVLLAKLVRLALTWEPSPRGMAVCKDTTSQSLCRAGLANGDFEDANKPDGVYGWLLQAGDYSPAPYLGKTPDSRVLALPGKGASALSSVALPFGSVAPADPEHTYTVKLRARGSGALPADVAVTLAVAKQGDPDSVRELASATRTVGWDWVDVDFRVDGIVGPEPAVLLVAIARTDGNTSTMLQVDDVRIERTPLVTTVPEM